MKQVIILIMLYLSSGGNAQGLELGEISSKIKQHVSSQNWQALETMPCFPVNNSCVSKESIAYIMNTNDLLLLFKNRELKINISRAFTAESDYPNSSFIITFYSPSIISLEDTLSSEEARNMWGKNYIQTEVILINGIPNLYRTIFYYGAHLPFASDYG